MRHSGFALCTRNIKGYLALFSLVTVLGLAVSGCKSDPKVVEREVTREVLLKVTQEVTVQVTVEVPKEVTRVVGVAATAEVQEPVELSPAIPFADRWVTSAHADTEAEAFRHWDQEDPPLIPSSCAKCHSTSGYHDFLGLHGTEPGVVNNDQQIGSVIECEACHNDVTLVMDSVVFPSGVEIAGLGDEARCMQCHQGRASTASVEQAIEESSATDEGTPNEDLGFVNIHYYAAAATQQGGAVMGGYQYEGKPYDVKFAHVEGFDACIDCHDAHTLEIKVEACHTCHQDVETKEDLKDIRMLASAKDYDGDGDLEEGIYDEVEGLQEILYRAIQANAQKAGTPIVYDAHVYPYFFVDTNGNAEVDEGEALYPNAYNAWTPRLLRAAYNYQASIKDPGAYAHNAKYIVQLLYDAIESLDDALAAGAQRIDAGHFAGSEEAFRHWDAEGQVPRTCSRCHSAGGLPLYLQEGAAISQPASNGFLCTTCHMELDTFSRYAVEQVQFPSGAVLSTGDPDSNVCLNCHQGRESTASVNRAIAGLDPDSVAQELSFRNVHYFAAGATLFGTDAQGAYEYDGKSYVGRNEHVEAYGNCVQCHDVHALEVRVEACATCHAGVESDEDLRSIRMTKVDYDGDGEGAEGIAGETGSLHQALYAAIQSYAANVAGKPIVYDAHNYPYFFIDANASGEVDPEEVNRDNGYDAWTPRLLQAAYNYQYAAKDPGAFAHNPTYILQVLYDSLEDLSTEASVDMTGMVRP